jgi:hypothetical protein
LLRRRRICPKQIYTPTPICVVGRNCVELNAEESEEEFALHGERCHPPFSPWEFCVMATKHLLLDFKLGALARP